MVRMKQLFLLKRKNWSTHFLQKVREDSIFQEDGATVSHADMALTYLLSHKEKFWRSAINSDHTTCNHAAPLCSRRLGALQES